MELLNRSAMAAPELLTLGRFHGPSGPFDQSPAVVPHGKERPPSTNDAMRSRAKAARTEVR
jgi:hypothetical protein